MAPTSCSDGLVYRHPLLVRRRHDNWSTPEAMMVGSFRCCLVGCLKAVLRVVLAARQPGVLRKNRPPEGAPGRRQSEDPFLAGGAPGAERPAQRPGDGTRHLERAACSQRETSANPPSSDGPEIKPPDRRDGRGHRRGGQQGHPLSFGRTQTMLDKPLETEISRGAIATIRERMTAALEHPVTEALNVTR